MILISWFWSHDADIMMLVGVNPDADEVNLGEITWCRCWWWKVRTKLIAQLDDPCHVSPYRHHRDTQQSRNVPRKIKIEPIIRCWFDDLGELPRGWVFPFTPTDPAKCHFGKVGFHMQVFNNRTIHQCDTIKEILIWDSDRGKRMRSSFRCPLCSTTGEDLMKNEETRQGIQEVCESISQICKRFSPQLGGGKKGSQLRIWRILFQLASRRLELMKTIEEELVFKVLVVPNITTTTLDGKSCSQHCN